MFRSVSITRILFTRASQCSGHALTCFGKAIRGGEACHASAHDAHITACVLVERRVLVVQVLLTPAVYLGAWHLQWTHEQGNGSAH